MLVCGATPAGAEPAPPPSQAAASDETCRAACGGVIARCTGVFGPAMGDMRPFCEQAVLRRCRTIGVKACAAGPTEPG